MDRSVRTEEWLCLQRLDLDLAEFHHAGAVLQGDRAGGVLGVLDVDGLFAVQDHRELRALGGDVVGIPLAAGVDDAGRLRDVGRVARPSLAAGDLGDGDGWRPVE